MHINIILIVNILKYVDYTLVKFSLHNLDFWNEWVTPLQLNNNITLEPSNNVD